MATSFVLLLIQIQSLLLLRTGTSLRTNEVVTVQNQRALRSHFLTH